MTTAPYGSWPSPISARMLVEDAVSLEQVAVDGTDVYWIEGRPSEGGRRAIVRWTSGQRPVDVLPEPYSARTRVHEYGGASFAVRDSVVWFANCDDQRVYRVDVDGSGDPRPITAEPTEPRAVRFADFDVSPDGTRLVAVRERHHEGGEVVNDVVVLDTGPDTEAQEPQAQEPQAQEPEVVAGGHDFFAAPRYGPDGRLAWLSWDHPNMPWDGTRLWISGDAGPVAGGEEESVSQPRWDTEGALHWASDRTGYWNIYRDGKLLVGSDAEFSGPDWVLGQSTYAILRGSGSVLAARTTGGLGELTLDGIPVPTSFTSFSSMQPHGERGVVAVVASPVAPAAVVRFDLSPSGTRAPKVEEVIQKSRPGVVDPGYVSRPRPVTFATDNGVGAHALFYAPANRDLAGPPKDLPPLVVMSHGGPTGSARSEMNLAVQYLTSRGVAVVDVDYGGSSGYGRAYRRRLDGQWGAVDVADCVNAARHLAAAGLVDRRRMAIRGSSAGGLTTLAALAFFDDFAAGAVRYGVTDLATLAADTHKFESRYLDRLVGPLPEAAETYRERSPSHHAGEITAPVLFLHGLEDQVVPPSQAQVMVDALRTQGTPVAYLTFEGEQHGFRMAETIVRAAEAELWFLGRALGFEPADEIDGFAVSNW